VTATTAGAKYFFNPIRKGSVASGESVVDVMTGQSLRFDVVSGEEAVKDPLMKGEDKSVDYIKVHLARASGEVSRGAFLLKAIYWLLADCSMRRRRWSNWVDFARIQCASGRPWGARQAFSRVGAFSCCEPRCSASSMAAIFPSMLRSSSVSVTI
jgi:hypothetical protein